MLFLGGHLHLLVVALERLVSKYPDGSRLKSEGEFRSAEYTTVPTAIPSCMDKPSPKPATNNDILINSLGASGLQHCSTFGAR